MRVPLAWKNLTHNKRRLALALIGIGFAVLLMFMQMGFRNGMLDSNVALLEALNADLIVTSPARYTLSVSEPFARQRLVQTLGCPGVAAAYPLYIESVQGFVASRDDRVARPIRVVAFDPNEPVFRIHEIESQRAALRLPHTALVDAMSKSDYGPMLLGSEIELSGRPVRVIGDFHLGTDFANDGNLLMSSHTLAAIYPQRPPSANPLDSVDLGLVRIAPGADPEEVRGAIVRRLPGDVQVFLKQEYIDQEHSFWNKTTPIGFIFGLGSALGFAVGVIICYQILYTDIVDHLPEFATLKAMGYPFRYFVGVVLAEAVWLAVLGFVPGAIVSFIAYQGLGAMTGLMMHLTVPRVLLILLLTIAMCVVSAGLAIRRLVGSDPAELFV